MGIIDKLPTPDQEGNFDPAKFNKEFLLMDAALAEVEATIERANSIGNLTQMAIAIKKGEEMITYMLHYIAQAYYVSKGRITLSPVFKNKELSFPYRPPELWDVIEGKQAPSHLDMEPVANESQDIVSAVLSQLEEMDKID